jgi:hypothetical protein
MKRNVAISIAIGILVISCSKSYNGKREGSAGKFTYTVTDTLGMSYTFSDSSYLVNNPPWNQIPYSINQNGSGVPLPAGYVDSTPFNYLPGDTSRIFYFQDANSTSQSDTNILRFSVPYFQDTLIASPQSFSLTLNNTLYTNDTITANFPYRGASLPFVLVNASVKTIILDSSYEFVTGTFIINARTNTAKTMAISGSFTGVPVIF